MRITKLLLICICFIAVQVQAWQSRGEVAAEGRVFTDGPGYADYWHNASASIKGEILHDWNERRDLFTFIPYARIDERDEERTHADIRELSWIHVADAWESRVGVRKVFWGVTEARHLVDIINQTDLVDQVDGEEKLGQAMINVSTVQNWGILDFYLLPGFRERTFPGEDGRPRLPFVVDVDNPIYESGAEEKHVDVAFRWQMFLGDWQMSLSHFWGTSREPLLLPTPLLPNLSGTDFVLTPFYQVIDQSGFELQYLNEGWLWKLEAISRSGQGDRYTALDGGLEFTQYGLFGSALDIGYIVEYMWEDRDALLASPFEHDWLLGGRLTFNDVASTEVLMGIVYDPHSKEKVITLESSRRFGDRWKASLEGRFYTNTGSPPTVTQVIQALTMAKVPDEALAVYGEEDQLQLEIIYYF